MGRCRLGTPLQDMQQARPHHKCAGAHRLDALSVCVKVGWLGRLGGGACWQSHHRSKEAGLQTGECSLKVNRMHDKATLVPCKHNPSSMQ